MNRVTLIGRVGKDPETRTISANGKNIPAARFSIAVSEKAYRNDDWITTWVYVKATGKAAELCSTIYKGDEILVDGKIAVDEYEKDGRKQTFVYVKASIIRVTKNSSNSSRQNSYNQDQGW